MYQGIESGWNHFSSIYGNPVCLSVRHLVTKNISIYNKQLCKSACLNMYMKFSANGSPRGRASNLENLYSFQILHIVVLNCMRYFNLLFSMFTLRNSGYTYTPTGPSMKSTLKSMWWKKDLLTFFGSYMNIIQQFPKILSFLMFPHAKSLTISCHRVKFYS